jgi:hypothetical protein
MRFESRILTCILVVLLHAVTLGADGTLPGFDYVVDTGGPVYGVGSGGGVWVSMDSPMSWEDRSAGLPVRVVYPFDGTQIRRIESLTYDPLDPVRVAVATKDRVFISSDAGIEWREVQVGKPVKSVDHITAVSVSPHDTNTIYLGTSFSGYYTSTDGGASWYSQKDSTADLYRGAGFYESITAIAVSPESPALIYLAAGMGGILYESMNGGGSWRSVGAPGTGEAEGIVNTISFVRDTVGEAWLPRIHKNSDVWIYSPTSAIWSQDERPVPALARRQLSSAKILRNRIAGNRAGIYVNPSRASGDALENHLDLLIEHRMDMIVVDMKDDNGRLTYDTDLTFPNDAGAVDIRFSLDELLNRAHNAGVYVVGRIVVFQDPKLYAFDDNAYAAWDSEAGTPWGNQREFWVDPYSEFVWRYNLAIAGEIEARGVDEIQFDYIRFPSDGDTSRIEYRFKRDRMDRVDAIESFLKLAREEIRIPISTDLYGFNAWYLMGGWIGQNIDVIADYVDVVCPMFYPSHFPGTFLSDLDYFDRAQAIYATGSNRAVSFADDRCVVRPYVQAFLIGAEREYETDEYTAYLTRQLEGVSESYSSGFTLWNASNIYYMITESLTRFTDH